MKFLSDIKKQKVSFRRKVTGAGNNSFLKIFVLGFIISLVACNDDLEINRGTNSEEEGVVYLYIPDVDEAAEFGATRSDEFQNTRAVYEAAEGRIRTLWFFAYPSENPGGATKMVSQLIGQQYLNITTVDGYKQYPLRNFATGNYHIYLIANFDDYLSNNISADLNEDELRALILNFPTDKTLEQTRLPMYCLNTEIKTSPNSSKSESGDFSVTENGSIYADLTFLCAKVRYTILFDRTENGFSYQFPNNNVNFSGAKVENLPKKTKLFDPKTNFSSDELFNRSSINFERKQYPAADSPYFDIMKTQQENAPANLNPASSTWTSNTAQRAWQGVIYVPENLSSGETMTKLTFTPNGENMQDSYSFAPKEFKRGQMYDLVAKMKDNDFEVDVKVEDWNLTRLAYILHGPYELVVESTHLVITSGEFSTMGYHTDVDRISFDFPTINITNSEGENVDMPLYVADFIKDGETKDAYGRPYNLSPNFEKHFHIRVNPEIPFSVLMQLKLYGEYTDEKEVTHTLPYTDKDGVFQDQEGTLDYFHIVAGNLHKRIATTLNLDAFLNVTPETINIETREYYLGSQDAVNPIPIYFFSNYQSIGTDVEFYLYDPSELIKGVGCKENCTKKDLLLDPGEGVDTQDVYLNYYRIKVRSGVLNLHLDNITAGHDYWLERHEYSLTFYLNVRDPRTGEMLKNPDGTNYIISKEVKIVIKPFTTNYTIHFYNASGYNWKKPHVFIYQDLLLPSDLTDGFNNANEKVDGRPYAGKIVGYRENNNGAITENAATQYVFSNNISFKGWDGYGGPVVNNPYDIYQTYINDSFYDNYRQGFIMLGKPSSRDTNWLWNYDYGYTNRNSMRDERYRFDVNFNEDHQERINKSTTGWNCSDCKSNYEKYKGSNKNYDYPGVMMEKDDEHPGWYTYTLTGVAQPGKTMIIFCDTHGPWNGGADGHGDEGWNPTTENKYRYPRDNATGLTLFDFEDNEGWFVFKGPNQENYDNSNIVTNHFFYDDKADAEAYINQN